MTLSSLQKAVYEALRNHWSLSGNGVPVIEEDVGNLVFERDSSLDRTYLAIEVGSPSFDPTSRDSGTIVGKARLSVTVYERPDRNRVGQVRSGNTALDVAESVACALNLLPFDGGVLVFTGIGGVERSDEKTISRTVSFETVATLSGE